MSTRSKLTALVTAVCLTALAGVVNAGEITVVATGGPLPEVMGVLGPMFEKASGHTVKLSIKGAPAIIKDVKEGASIDLIVAGDDAISGLVKDGLIAAGSSAKVMQSRVGLGVRTGAPKPDISTVDALKAALLAAKTVAHSQGTSGQYFTTVVAKLGIADALPADVNRIIGYSVGIPSKAKEMDAAKAFAKFIASGEALAAYKQKGMEPAS